MSTTTDHDWMKHADVYLDADDQIRAFTAMGEQLYAAFPSKSEERISTQVRNLQQIVISARRLSDIEVFIKNQMGRGTGQFAEWRQVGPRLLEQLETLRAKAKELTKDESQLVRIRTYLAKGWIRTIVGSYLYQRAMTGVKRG